MLPPLPFHQSFGKCPPRYSSDNSRRSPILLVVKARLDIGLGGTNRLDGEILDQDIQHGGGNNCGQRWPEANVLDTQVQQRKQNGHCLLLVPGQDDRKR